ncbi:hypothetical protein RRG08_055122 [Elysia crispata]|uniref:Uncharacterized protein n=1 Tax=Elysia crispata TaxID=231223 RepID=A0AAE1AMD5_9GAST|nr:hypothetical protein RRG08_055122 [Elysia crispata]
MWKVNIFKNSSPFAGKKVSLGSFTSHKFHKKSSSRAADMKNSQTIRIQLFDISPSSLGSPLICFPRDKNLSTIEARITGVVYLKNRSELGTGMSFISRSHSSVALRQVFDSAASCCYYR